DFVAVAGGYKHSLGLKADGSIVAWGRNNYGQCDVPAPNTYFVAVAAGFEHSLGLKAYGSIVAWGYNYAGQCNVPEPNTDFVAVAGGGDHNLGLKSSGCPGDCNCDGAVSWRDIDYFVAAMNDKCAAWAAMFLPGVPTCPFSNNDVNGDGTVNWRDIDPFVAVMNTTCP
ncbi:MAG: hypothetical protein KAY37_14595, partial [Phycisphaerae bacterium]|nr:hypothetical protein [Phycisphaerae bacterium]